MQYVLRSPDTLIKVIDSFVDGKRFRSRNQIINIVMADWAAREKIPDDPYAIAFAGEDATVETARKREAMKQDFLEDYGDKYLEQQVDFLNGDFKQRMHFEEMERIAELDDRYKEVIEKGIKLAEERLEAKFNDLLVKIEKAIPQIRETEDAAPEQK